MDTNKIYKPEISKATTTQIQEMNNVVTRIVELIKEKHL
jgi:hypothetical protein